MRISFKLLVISEVVLLVTVLVLIVPVWDRMRRQVVENMQNELKAIASTAALDVDGDLHVAVQQSGDARSSAFRTIRTRLDAIARANEIAYDKLYTFYRDGEEVRFAVMLHPDPFVGDSYELQDLMRPVFDNGEMIATELYEDDHGEWISAYAPIRDSTGAVVGLLEVDKNSEEYFAEFNDYLRFTVAIALLALVVSSFLGWIVLQRVVIRPLHSVREGMLALGRQDFSHTVSLRTGDELQELGDTFNELSQQMNVASVVQASFFPRSMPKVPGYDLAGASEPCDATGGDYYDAFKLDDDRVAVVLADVSGHGIGPSLLMATCRSALRALARTNLTPAQLVESLNQILAEDLSNGRFITLLYGVLLSDGSFTYSNAGHGPALEFTSDRTVLTTLDAHRPPLGIMIPMDDDPQETTIRMSAGDRLLITSDGVMEAMGPGNEHFGIERMSAIARRNDIDAGGVVVELRSALMRHLAGRPSTDDVTILCIDRR